jgi:hypothetical protein
MKSHLLKLLSRRSLRYPAFNRLLNRFLVLSGAGLHFG